MDFRHLFNKRQVLQNLGNKWAVSQKTEPLKQPLLA